MKYYDLNTEFTFGKYKGRTVQDVLNIQPSYIDWCAVYLDHFFITNETISELKSLNKDFSLTEKGLKRLDEKFDNWKTDRENYRKSKNYHHRERTFDNYSGSYAQEVEGWSDEDIDDVFDGYPDAYWNID